MKRVFTAVRRHFLEKRYYYVAVLLSLVLLGMGIFCFPNAIGRLTESGRDFWRSLAYAFCELFNIDTDITPTVNELPDYSYLNAKDWFYNLIGKRPATGESPSTFIPVEWEDFKAGWVRYWKAFANKRNFLRYVFFLLQVLYYAFLAVALCIPVFFGIRKLFRKYYFREKRIKEQSKRLDCENAQENEEEEPQETGEPIEQPITDSRPLRAWRWLYFKIILRVVLWFVGFVEWVKERPTLWQFWLSLVLLYFNVITIVIEFCAYYLYFLCSVDVYNLYRQVYKLFLDLYAVFSVLSIVAWFALGYLGIERFIKYVRYEQIEREIRDMEDFLSKE